MSSRRYIYLEHNYAERFPVVHHDRHLHLAPGSEGLLNAAVVENVSVKDVCLNNVSHPHLQMIVMCESIASLLCVFILVDSLSHRQSLKIRKQQCN